MATDMNRLQGEVIDNPTPPAMHEGQDERDGAIESMVVGFLRALLAEQNQERE